MKTLMPVVKAAVLAVTSVSCSVACAEAVVAGFQEVRTVSVPADAVQSGDIMLAPRAMLRKTGEGKLTVPTSTLHLNAESGIEVVEGGLRIQPTAVFDTDVPEGVSNVLLSAAAWFDSKNESSLVKDGANVTDWLDTRETGGAGGYSYSRAVADVQFFASDPKYPIVKTDEESGCSGVYFNGVQSGSWMKFISPRGDQWNCLAYHAFVIHGVRSGLGNVLGLRKRPSAGINAAFYPGNSAGTALSPLWPANTGEEALAISTARTYVNGELYDGMRTSFTSSVYEYPEGFTLLETEMLRQPGMVNCFYNDRGYVGDACSVKPVPSEFDAAGGLRLGGDYLGEVVLFTNQLTSAERLLVERYLIAKWFGVKRPELLDISVGSAASVEIVKPAAGQEALAWRLSGDGVMNKNDSDESLGDQGLENFVGRINLGPAASIGHLADFAFALEPGREYGCSDGEDNGNRRLVTSIETPSLGKKSIKSGTGEIKVCSVAEDVERLTVDEGALRLSVPMVGSSCQSERRVRAVVPNGSFEEGTQFNGRGIDPGSEYLGWHADFVTDGGFSEVFIFNRNGTYNNTGAWKPMADNIPDGVCALGIKKNATVWTEIEIPESGFYRLRFRASMRGYNWDGGLGHRLQLAVGNETDEPTVFAHYCGVVGENIYRPYSYLMPYLEKGTYRLWFRSPGDNDDRTTLIDCVSVEKDDPGEDWLLPNGNFESISSVKGEFSDFHNFTSANAEAVCGWTLVQPDTLTPFAQVAPATPLMHVSSISDHKDNPGWFYDMAEGDGSAVNLQLCHGGSASCTFTPPSGEWRLRVDAKTFRASLTDADYVNFHATVTRSGKETDLGTVTHVGTLCKQIDTFPESMIFDGTTEVTVKLWCELTKDGSRGSTAKNAHLGIDNVRLVPVRQNLVSNGGFENGWTGWSHAKSEILDMKNSSNKENYGANQPEGRYCLRLLNDDVVKQTIEVSREGDYCLEARMRSRLTWRGMSPNGLNPVRAWLLKDGITNEVFSFFAPSTTNFVRYAWNLRIAEAGTYEFALEGGTISGDKSTLVDSVSISPVRLASDVPTLSPALKIAVKSGASIRLDYPGTATVSRVTCNGVSMRGVLTSETGAGFVSGPGALKIVPQFTNGVVIIVR